MESIINVYIEAREQVITKRLLIGSMQQLLWSSFGVISSRERNLIL